MLSPDIITWYLSFHLLQVQGNMYWCIARDKIWGWRNMIRNISNDNIFFHALRNFFSMNVWLSQDQVLELGLPYSSIWFEAVPPKISCLWTCLSPFLSSALDTEDSTWSPPWQKVVSGPPSYSVPPSASGKKRWYKCIDSEHPRFVENKYDE